MPSRHNKGVIINTIIGPQQQRAGSAPSITGQPADGEYDGETAVTLTVTATGTPAPTYQWQSSVADADSWSNIGGATSASYDAEPEEDTDYRCVVTNAVGEVTSDEVVVTVASEYLNDPLTNGDQVDTGVSGSSTWSYSAAGAYYDGVTAGLGMIRWQLAPNTPNDADFSVKVEPRYNITTQFVTIDVMLDAYPGDVARNAFTIRHLNTTLTLLKCDDVTGEQTVATASVAALLGSNGERLYQIVVHDNGDDTYDVVVTLDGTPEITQANVPHIGGFGTDTGIRWYSPGSGYAVWISDALGV